MELNKKIAKFEKVSFEQYKKDYLSCFPNKDEEYVKEMYDKLKLPKRATKGSAGYDFYTPEKLTLLPGTTVKIPTGIRVKIDEGWFLGLFPRSGLGFKYRLQLDNTVGIIDSDYYGRLNQGHMFAKITNDTKNGKVLHIGDGDAYMQGIFLPFGITVDDESNEVRNGGFGSTTK